ncbi:MAG: hypothetical protein ACI9W2_004900 [Gammaproteobacteria bacterium]|jgi:hypothetical protein
MYLEQTVDNITALVDRAPQILSLAANGHEDFIKVRAVTVRWALSSNTPRLLGPEFCAPAKRHTAYEIIWGGKSQPR